MLQRKLPLKAIFTICLLIASLHLGGCGGGDDGSVTPRFAYVANNGSNNVFAFTIDSTTGALTPIPGSPFPPGTFPRCVTLHPSGGVADVAKSNSNHLSPFPIQ